MLTLAPRARQRHGVDPGLSINAVDCRTPGTAARPAEKGRTSDAPTRSTNRCRSSDCMDSRRGANGSPTCSSAPKPIGSGGRLPGRVLTGPRFLAGATPTARAPCAGQPLHEHALAAPRTPSFHFGANGGRGRVRHALGKPETAAPDDERRGMMNSNSVPLREPVPLREAGAPGLVHVDDLDAAPSALALNGGEELPRAARGAHTSATTESRQGENDRTHLPYDGGRHRTAR